MIRYQRPAKPADFDDKCEAPKNAVSKAIASNESTIDFGDGVWGNYKGVLSDAQSGKCGYCEIFVVAGQNGDVEHYRPKAQAFAEIRNPGSEKDNLGNVKNRRFGGKTKPAYWQYAYEWNNYLLSCMNCNQKWKRDYFPVEGPRAIAPGKVEEALLLNPYSRRDPINHLYFDDLGAISAFNKSKYGQATIDTCGLYRASLTRARVQQARSAHQLARELLVATDSGSDDDYATAVLDIHEAGKTEYQFAGIVRAVIKHRCKMKWKEIEDMAAHFEGS